MKLRLAIAIAVILIPAIIGWQACPSLSEWDEYENPLKWLMVNAYQGLIPISLVVTIPFMGILKKGETPGDTFDLYFTATGMVALIISLTFLSIAMVADTMERCWLFTSLSCLMFVIVMYNSVYMDNKKQKQLL